jgi:hypothetical protein
MVLHLSFIINIFPVEWSLAKKTSILELMQAAQFQKKRPSRFDPSYTEKELFKKIIKKNVERHSSIDETGIQILNQQSDDLLDTIFVLIKTANNKIPQKIKDLLQQDIKTASIFKILWFLGVFVHIENEKDESDSLHIMGKLGFTYGHKGNCIKIDCYHPYAIEKFLKDEIEYGKNKGLA